MIRSTVVGFVLALTSASTGHAQTTAAPPASLAAAEAYSADSGLYAQLRVNLATPDGGGSATAAEGDCPRNGFGVEDWRDLMRGEHAVTMGFTVTLPAASGTGQTIAYEPIVLSIRKRLFSVSCQLTLVEREYRSPLYALETPPPPFTVQMSVHDREGATGDVTNTIAAMSQATAGLASIPAPMAATIGAEVKRNLEAVGRNISETHGSDIYVDQPVPQAWSQNLVLGNRTIQVTVTPRLVNRASLFSASATRIDAVTALDLSVARILDFPLDARLPGQPPQTIEQYLTAQNPVAFQQFRDAATPEDLQRACANLAQVVGRMGLNPLDRGAILWALGRRHGLNGNADQMALGDQIACVQDYAVPLKAAHVALLEPAVVVPPPPLPVTRNATVAEMRAAVATDDRLDNLTQFFKTTDQRGDAADRLFAYPVALTDPDTVLLPVARRPARSSADWIAYAVRQGQPFLTRLGCYRYVAEGDSTVKAIGAASLADGDHEYLVVMTFAGVGADGVALIRSLSLSRDITPTDVALIRGTRQDCGDGWRPTLLFPAR